MITFLRFGRAHTLIGTTVSLLTLYLLATRQTGVQDWQLFAVSLFVCLAANVYITGLNQLTDVEIDRINKPYLPLASGAYSMATGRSIVITCLGIATVGCFTYSPYLPITVLSSIAIGTAYSLEPIRLKRYHFWAAFCIIVVRGLIVNLVLFMHFAHSLSSDFSIVQVPPQVWLLTAIIFIFGVIIAWFKDLPDVEGDSEFEINTLSIARSPEWVYRNGARLLTITLAASCVFCLTQGWVPLGVSLAFLLIAFLNISTQLKLEDQSSIARFYQGTWVIFFGIYLAFAAYG